MSRFSYDARMRRVAAYVDEHLDEELDLHALAELAGVSPYHWHRIYHATQGESILARLERVRLERAAHELTETTIAIPEIAERSGYANPAAFARIFQAYYGQAPARYRLRGGRATLIAPVPEQPTGHYHVAVERMPPLYVITMPHRGSYAELGKTFDALYGWLNARQLTTPGMRSISVFYDDPSVVGESQLEARAGVTIGEDAAVEWPLERTQLIGRDYAVLTHVGSYARIAAAYQWLYGVWLPASGREVADEPVFEEYFNSPLDTPADQLMTNICLPLQNAA